MQFACLYLCRSLLSVLQLAFVQCTDTLREQLDAAVETANQRPGSLQSFIAWQAAMLSHTQPMNTISRCQGAYAVAAARCSSPQQQVCWQSPAEQQHVPGGAAAGPKGSVFGSDAVRAGLLLQVEGLRVLLDIMRCVVACGDAWAAGVAALCRRCLPKTLWTHAVYVRQQRIQVWIAVGGGGLQQTSVAGHCEVGQRTKYPNGPGRMHTLLIAIAYQMVQTCPCTGHVLPSQQPYAAVSVSVVVRPRL
jgi:hypothetical protein